MRARTDIASSNRPTCRIDHEERTMQPRLTALEIDAMVLHAADHFAKPGDVVKEARLTTAQKQRILESWALDAELLSQAESENMHGDEQPRLREVKLALLSLRCGGV